MFSWWTNCSQLKTMQEGGGKRKGRMSWKDWVAPGIQYRWNPTTKPQEGPNRVTEYLPLHLECATVHRTQLPPTSLSDQSHHFQRWKLDSTRQYPWTSEPWQGDRIREQKMGPWKPLLWATKTLPRDQGLGRRPNEFTTIENAPTQVVTTYKSQDSLNANNRNQLKLV